MNFDLATIWFSVKLLIVAVVVYALVASAKVTFPKFTGRHAFLLNAASSLIGALIVTPYDHLFEYDTFRLLLTAIATSLSASGIHSVVEYFIGEYKRIKAELTGVTQGE